MRAKLSTIPLYAFPNQRFTSPSRLAFNLLTNRSAPPLPLHHRLLTTTPPLPKHSGGKQNSKRTVPLNASKAASLNPFDYTDYDAAIARILETLRSELARVKAGNHDPGVIEDVRVKLGGGGGRDKQGGKGKGKVRVGDVASVVRRGRNVGVIVGEKDVGTLPLSLDLHSPFLYISTQVLEQQLLTRGPSASPPRHLRSLPSAALPPPYPLPH